MPLIAKTHATHLRHEIKIWSLYLLTIVTATWLHEAGHCIPAWISGYKAIPTFAKAYAPHHLPAAIDSYTSLGGVIVSMLLPIFATVFFLRTRSTYKNVLLAGFIAMPAAYTLRFILAGRGHDSDEFQQAQAALGLSYAGHTVDWAFLSICIIGIAAWIFKSKPNFSMFCRLALGAAVTVLFIVALQKINNLVFDPIFGN